MSNKKVTSQTLLAKVVQFEKAKVENQQRAYDAIMQRLVDEADFFGGRSVSIPLVDEYAFLIDDITQFTRTLDNGFSCHTKPVHAYQCKCGKTEGCITGLVVEF